METVMQSEINVLNSRLEEQANFLKKITELDEEYLSVEELISESLQILFNDWVSVEILAVKITYLNSDYFEGNFSDKGTEISSYLSENGFHSLDITILAGANSDLIDTDKKFLDVAVHILRSKLKRIETNQNLREEQEFLDKAYKLARIGTWEYDMANDHLCWSDVTKDIHGFEKEHQPDVESTVLLFKEGFHRQTFAKTVKDAIERYQPFDVELKIISGQGDERWIRATGEPEFNEEGDCVRFYGISQNVTNRKQSAEDLQLSERRFRALVQDGSDMIAIVDKNAVFKYVSPTSMKILGIPADELIGQSALEYVHNEDKEHVFSKLLGLSYKESVYVNPYRFADAGGNWRWVETTLTNLTQDPAVNGYVANSRDITEKYLRQQKMEGSLHEKETLLSEIHHRINNNLTVLTSMLQLQASNENNREVLDRLADSVTRVHAMANIHEQLYQSNNFSELELSGRIKLLVMNIQNTFKLETDIDVTFDCDHILLDVDKALPASLILNEVITNIFKYAFKGRDTGKITVGLKKQDEMLHITVKDNGVGLPEDFEELGNSSLGLTLIKNLAAQLKAQYQYKSDQISTEFSLRFRA